MYYIIQLMNIGIDAGCLGIKDERLKVGVYHLTFNLLATLGRIDRQNDYWLYSFAQIQPVVLAEFGPKMKNIVVKPAMGWNSLALPLSLTFRRPDVFFGPSQSLPFFLPCPAIVVVHDLAFEIFPDFYPGSYRQLRRVTCQATQKAKKIVAVSQSTKNDLIRLYNIPREKITVIYEGRNSQIFNRKTDRQPKNYFLFVGSLKKSKNVPGLLKGFKYFLEKSGRNFQLLVVGGNLWLDQEIKKTIEGLDLQEKIDFRGFVESNKLAKIYQEATALVSPAFYEGFGLPLLEAMACGCPVICGKDGSQPEVVGKVGILVDPQNVKEIGKAMMQVADDSYGRQKMVTQGVKRAKLFSWSRFAQQILDLLKKS